MGVAESSCGSPDIPLLFTFRSLPCSYVRTVWLASSPWTWVGVIEVISRLGPYTYVMWSLLSFSYLQQWFQKPRGPGGIAQDGGGPPSQHQPEIGGRDEPRWVKATEISSYCSVMQRPRLAKWDNRHYILKSSGKISESWDIQVLSQLKVPF